VSTARTPHLRIPKRCGATIVAGRLRRRQARRPPPYHLERGGDYDGSNDATVDELVTMVNIALGATPLSAWTAGDGHASGEVTIDEILAAVNNALNACGA
jgi:hypothetical protein